MQRRKLELGLPAIMTRRLLNVDLAIRCGATIDSAGRAGFAALNCTYSET